MLKKLLFSIVLVSLMILPGGLNHSTTWGQASSPVLLGIYPSGSLGMTTHEINQLDTYLGGNKISIAGGFSDFEFPDAWITSELDAAWNNGYWPLINIGAGTMDDTAICPNDPNGDDDYSDEIKCTAEKIANGDLDPAITNWAQEFKAWSDNGNKTAYLAPLQEMNGEWIDYFGYGDPTKQNYYKQAFIRIQDIFINQVGVDPDSVIWIFAPNGYSESTSDNFENYYPGDSAVDIIGFSSFNWCDCWNYTDPEWYEDIYEPYLLRMTTMAPGKPIFIVEIASETYDDGTHTPDYNRADWFTDTLTKIGNYPGVEGVIYFNRSENPYYTSDNCNPPDYSLDANGAEGKSEFRDVVTQPPYGYLSPSSVEGDHIGMYSRTQKTWYLKDVNTDGWSNVSTFRFGSVDTSWLPVEGDWNGDGSDTIGMYSRTQKTWYLKDANTDGWANVTTVRFGSVDTSWIPVVGDWNGNGTDTIGMYSRTQKTWYLKEANTDGWTNVQTVRFGSVDTSWIPVVGDWNGNGTDTIGMYSRTQKTWYLKDANTDGWSNVTTVRFGSVDTSWLPVVGDWNNSGDDTIGMYSRTQKTWYLKYANNNGWSNVQTTRFGSTDTSWLPVTGGW